LADFDLIWKLPNLVHSKSLKIRKMTIRKILFGGIGGGVTLFLLGWLFYGMLLAGFMADNAGSATGVSREMDQMQMWALMLGNLSYGFLLAIIFGRWANIQTAASGMKAGLILGLLIGAGIDFILYGVSNLMNLTAVFVDIITFAVMTAISGAVVALILGAGQKAKPETV
jgi:hypothetical protein